MRCATSSFLVRDGVEEGREDVEDVWQRLKYKEARRFWKCADYDDMSVVIYIYIFFLLQKFIEKLFTLILGDT